MSIAETLASTVEYAKPNLRRYLQGFTDETRVAQAPSLPNHVIWTLGHLALYMHRAANRINGCDDRPLPDEHFLTGDGEEGQPTRFDTESVCFGSRPMPQTSIYPTLDAGKVVFNAAIEHLASTVRELGDGRMDDQTHWGRQKNLMSIADLVRHMIYHNATHTGQIVDLRRALCMPPII